MDNEKYKIGGGIFGSLSKHVARIVKEHQHSNMALIAERYTLGAKLLSNLLGKDSLIKLLFLYIIFLILLLILEKCIVYNFWYFRIDLIIEKDKIDQVINVLSVINTVFLTVQVTMIALIFPVAIALVTFLVERQGASSDTDIQLYYKESFAYDVGRNSISLVVILSFIAFWPSQYLPSSPQIRTINLFTTSVLSIVHLLWLSINIFGIWYFLKTSLNFVQPTSRAKLRKRFASIHVVPREIAHNLMQNIYLNSSNLMFGETVSRGSNIKIMFGHGYGLQTKPEVIVNFRHPVRLVDVRMRVVYFICKRWLSKLDKHNHETKDFITFPTELDVVTSGDIILCARSGGPALNHLDKILVKFAFRFERDKK
ncbi:MAG: hypothetical protein JAZ13_08225 [Candidatus Thiodiazotropha taylori]|nr:hypothetical protein [Candidatus Thiodiazotropha taylori]